MAEKSRELSQFASFLLVDNSTGNISISTESTPNIGIGTTNPQYKLHVIGDTNISGIISASSFYVEGQGELVNPTIDKWSSGTGGDIYRLLGNVGIGTSVLSQKFTVIGNTTISGILTSNSLNVESTATASQFISTVSTGTQPFEVTSTTRVNNLNANFLNGKTAPTGSIVGTTDTQLLANKQFSDNTVFFVDNSDNTKQFRFEVSGISTSTARIITIPDESGTLVLQGQEGIITTEMIANLEIINEDVSVSAGISYSKLDLENSIVNSDIQNSTIENSKLVNNTISGVALGSTLSALTLGNYLSFTSGSTYTGAEARTVSIAATSTNTSNEIVARDSSGNFSAENITASNFTKNGGSSNEFLKADGSVDSTNYTNYSRSLAYNLIFN